MAQVIASNPTCIRLGVEEDTAIIVRKGADAEVVGSGIVIVIEGFDIIDSNILDHGSTEKVYITILKSSCYLQAANIEFREITPLTGSLQR